MSDNRTTLLPCPFCGGEAEPHEVGFPYHYWDVWCDGECFDHFCEKPTEAEAIAAWNTRADCHAYEQRITGDGSDWGEIMCDAFDSLIASACDACTFDELERFEAHIMKEMGK